MPKKELDVMATIAKRVTGNFSVDSSSAKPEKLQPPEPEQSPVEPGKKPRRIELD